MQVIWSKIIEINTQKSYNILSFTNGRSFHVSFDALKVKNDIVEWIKKWFEKNGKGCKGVVGISGGKDSSVVAALLVEA